MKNTVWQLRLLKSRFGETFCRVPFIRRSLLTHVRQMAAGVLDPSAVSLPPTLCFHYIQDVITEMEHAAVYDDKKISGIFVILAAMVPASDLPAMLTRRLLVLLAQHPAAPLPRLAPLVLVPQMESLRFWLQQIPIPGFGPVLHDIMLERVAFGASPRVLSHVRAEALAVLHFQDRPSFLRYCCTPITDRRRWVRTHFRDVLYMLRLPNPPKIAVDDLLPYYGYIADMIPVEAAALQKLLKRLDPQIADVLVAIEEGTAS